MAALPFHVVITEGSPEMAPAQAFVADPAFGAVATFSGIIRNTNEGRTAEAVTYDVHEALALQTIRELCLEALKMAAGPARIYVAHAKGTIKVGEASVVIAVGTPHRKESFRICEFMIDSLKARAPIWKQEHYAGGESAWLGGTPLPSA